MKKMKSLALRKCETPKDERLTMTTRFLILLSPAKNLNPNPMTKGHMTEPVFQDEAGHLIQTLQNYSPSDLAKLMKLSTPLAKLNHDRFKSFNLKDSSQSKGYQALFTFDGQAYASLEATNLSNDALDYLHHHLCILSGLYGFLRPTDAIQPYRLEMSTALSIDGKANLYAFWKDKLTAKLNEIIQKDCVTHILNCASDEYASAIHFKHLLAPVITCQFQDFKNEEYKTIGIYAKKARGLMVRYLAQQKAASLQTVQAFPSLGYRFSKESSSDDHYIFLRKA
jgi:cytoplasmic iron level regulating protein YaaA (DUF328/UPF0246 family)